MKGPVHGGAASVAKGGDNIQFLREFEGLGYREAVRAPEYFTPGGGSIVHTTETSDAAN